MKKYTLLIVLCESGFIFLFFFIAYVVIMGPWQLLVGNCQTCMLRIFGCTVVIQLPVGQLLALVKIFILMDLSVHLQIRMQCILQKWRNKNYIFLGGVRGGEVGGQTTQPSIFIMGSVSFCVWRDGHYVLCLGFLQHTRMHVRMHARTCTCANMLCVQFLRLQSIVWTCIGIWYSWLSLLTCEGNPLSCALDPAVQIPLYREPC